MALTDKDKVKTHLKITSTGQDNLILQLIPQVASAIRLYLGYDPEQSSETIYLNGNGRSIIRIPRLPIYSISDLRIDQGGYAGKGTNAFPAASAITEGTDYVIDYTGNDSRGTQYSMNGHLIRLLRQGWIKGIRNIKITFTGGWPENAIPPEIELAATVAVGAYVVGSAGSASGSVKSQKLGDYMVTFEKPTGEESNAASEMILPRPSRILLNPYRIIPMTSRVAI